MAELEKVIKGLECCLNTGNFEECTENCPYFTKKHGMWVCAENMQRDALSLLKAQELPDVKPEKLEERTTKWLDQMTAEERLKEIAAILDDWDGYRTAKGLGGLINEVWAYALYPVKAQEPRVMTLEDAKQTMEGEIVWVEQWTRSKVFLMPMVSTGDGRLGNFYLGLNLNEMNPHYYRVWRGKPTDEQREATQWEN